MQLGTPKTAHVPTLEHHQLPHGSSTHSLTALAVATLYGTPPSLLEPEAQALEGELGPYVARPSHSCLPRGYSQ